MKVREFLKANSLRQVDIARYLGVTEAAVSNVVKGKSEFSEENLIKILNNPYGWDTSLLEKPEDSVTKEPQLVAEHIPQLSNVEILLRELLAEKEAKIDALQGRINELIEENARLKTLLEQKGGNAPDAEHFSSADAV